MADKQYSAENIYSDLDSVRKNFDIVELRRKVKKVGNLLVLSHELRIKPYVLGHALEEARILPFFPNLHKSKASALSRLISIIEPFIPRCMIYKIGGAKNE